MTRSNHPLAGEWRTRAEKLSAWGSATLAKVWQTAADELDAYENERALEALTLKEAAKESGYSQAHLGRLLAEGKVEMAGKKGSPRIRRNDLPKKARPLVHSDTDLVGRVLKR